MDLCSNSKPKDFISKASEGRVYDYKLSVIIEEEAVKKLKKANLNLCLVKSVMSSGPVGDLLPTIWVSTPDFDKKNVFTWKHEVEGYLTDSKRNENIIPSSSYPLPLGKTLEISGDGDKKLAQVKVTGVFNSNAVTLRNRSNSDVAIGLLQRIAVNGRDLGMIPITVQTLKEKSCRLVYPIEQVLVTFVPSTVETGSIVMETNEYPGMTVIFEFDQDEKEIIWAIRGAKDKLIEPGFWFNANDEAWGVVIPPKFDLHYFLSNSDVDSTI